VELNRELRCYGVPIGESPGQGNCSEASAAGKALRSVKVGMELVGVAEAARVDDRASWAGLTAAPRIASRLA
jgi:hypothetical protein